MATEGIIKFDVRCLGCGELIRKPSDADMNLFRVGINIHNDQDCYIKAAAKLHAGGRK